MLRGRASDHRWVRWVFASLLLVPFSAHGGVRVLTQPPPDESPIPQGTHAHPGELSLQDIMDAEEGPGAIDVSVDDGSLEVDAAVTPATFRPHCDLAFEVFERGGWSNSTFGWYNVTGERPDASDLHEIVQCTHGKGAVVTGADIGKSPEYLGGEIGFYLASQEWAGSGTTSGCPSVSQPGSYDYVFYTEAEFNDSDGLLGFTYVLIVDSKVDPSAFYFGWEDAPSGDWDFNDLVVRVSGITCAGGGEPCELEELRGKCTQGVWHCVNGEVSCRQLAPATAEVCNAVDDNCDGYVDNGDELCAALEICDRGVCRPRCGRGEFYCPGGQECEMDSGLCMEPECIGVTCPAGERCSEGTCRGECHDIVCPHGQTCSSGKCVDPCAGITCEANYVCKGGGCVVSCECEHCPPETACSAQTLLCTDVPCAAVTCDVGTHCVDGACIDDCDGVHCPGAAECVAGECAEPPPPSESGTGGSGPIDVGAEEPAGDASVADGGDASAATADERDSINPTPACACEVPGSRERRMPFGTLAALGCALWAGVARRRRSR